jgi:hypothetical protein
MQFEDLLASETLVEVFNPSIDDWGVLILRPKTGTLVYNVVQITYDLLSGWSANVIGTDGEVTTFSDMTRVALYQLLHTIIEEGLCTQE